MLFWGLAWKRNCLSHSLSLLSHVTLSLVHYAHRCPSLQINTASRISIGTEGLWFEIRRSQSGTFLPSITQSRVSSAHVHFWIDHMVGKAWNEWRGEWNRSTLTDQANPEGCPKTLGQVEGIWQALHSEMARTLTPQWTRVIYRDPFSRMLCSLNKHKCKKWKSYFSLKTVTSEQLYLICFLSFTVKWLLHNNFYICTL